MHIKISSPFKPSSLAVSCITMFQTVNHDTFVKYNSFPIKIFFKLWGMRSRTGNLSIFPYPSVTWRPSGNHHESARCRSLSHVLSFVISWWLVKNLIDIMAGVRPSGTINSMIQLWITRKKILAENVRKPSPSPMRIWVKEDECLDISQPRTP